MALIDDDAGAPVYDLAVLNEDSVDLRLPVCVELEACDPGRAFEVIDRPYARDFEVSEGLLFGKNELKVQFWTSSLPEQPPSVAASARMNARAASLSGCRLRMRSVLDGLARRYPAGRKV